MRRFHQLATISLTLIFLALTFHLLAISFYNWRTTTCKTCSNTDLFKEWRTSILHRCYRAPIVAILFSSVDATNITHNPFVTDFCIPNKYLYPRKPIYIEECLEAARLGPHTVCLNKEYNNDMCKCDYTENTKAVVALAVISSIALGFMIILAHVTSYITHDFILKWLVPAGFTLLLIAFISMFATLIIMGVSKNEDANEMSSWILLDSLNNSTSNMTNGGDILKEFVRTNYNISIGWCFGLEFVAVFFTLTTIVVYGLKFLTKKRPENEN